MQSCKSILIKQIYDLNLENLKLKIIYDNKGKQSYINKREKKDLNNIKEYICNLDNWLVYRIIFNSLTLLNFHDEKKNNIGIYNKKVLSRSYFKMIEIVNDYNILNNFSNKNINIAFIAEAPGGFIESINYLRNNKNDNYYGISLIDNNKNIPNWNNLKKQNIINLKLLYGNDKTGNIYKLRNILNYINIIGENKCEIVTADGGFDFTIDYNNQEYNFLKLFLCEIVLGLQLQKIGGIFIIKCFDLTHIISIKLFYILCHLYEKIIITKLKTSRQTNSERYIICKNLKKKLNNNIIKILYEIIIKWDNKYNISNILDIQINENFLKKLEIYNKWFYLKQLNIYNIIFSIDINKKYILKIINIILENNIKKNILFCKYNNLNINKNSIFLKKHIYYNIIYDKFKLYLNK